MAENQNTTAPSWARYDNDGYEVSSAGDQRFSALSARFNEGTKLGSIDISGRTIEDVYQNVIKRSGKGQAPAKDSILYNEALTTPAEMEDYSYDNGYLPLWTMWAQQHPVEIAYLKVASAGRPLTDRFAATRVSQARALADILSGGGALYSDEELSQWFSAQEKHIDPRSLEGYDIYSVGTGKESISEFWEKIPQDATVIVDMRNYRGNTYYRHFDTNTFSSDIGNHGIRYQWVKALSGKSKDVSTILRTDGKKPVFDYGRIAAQGSFQDALSDIRGLVAAGEKVVLVSGESGPAFSARALLVGQELERTTGLHIGHIDRTPGGRLRTRSQEEVIAEAVGRGYRITEGDYRGLTFHSDRTFDAAPGTKVTRHKIDAPDTDRTIQGQWNYSTEVAFAEDDTAQGQSRSALSSVYIKNAEKTDYSVVFTFHGLDRDTAAALDASSYKNMKIALPQHKEDYYDEALIERTAGRISGQIARFLVYKYTKGTLKYVDTDHMTLGIEGANIARIANEYVEDPALDGLSAADRNRLGNTGMTMDDITAINQDDVNHFITEVMRAVQRNGNTFQVSEEADEQVFHIDGIHTSGQSGVAEAATVASQALGLKTSVLAPKGFRYTIDNETVTGRTIADRPSFVNRFHQGLHNDVSLRNLQEQIDELDYRRMIREDGMQTGLTDRQVLVLYNLGFGNSDIIDIVDLAAANAVSVNSPSDMEDLLERCAGYGIATSGITNEDIVAAFDKAERQQEAWKAEGVTFISTMSPYYPENLRMFHEAPKREYRTVENIGEDGTVSYSVEPYDVVEKRPALLWLKGDISLLQEPSVSLSGGVTTSNDTAAAARYVGSVLADGQMPAVLPLDGGAPAQAADEIVSRGGRVIAVLPDGIKTSVSDPAQRMEKINGRIDEINAELEEFPEGERRDALQQERDSLFAELDDLSRKDPSRGDAEKAVVDKGGLLASAAEPDSVSTDGEHRSLAARIATGMGYTCLFLEEMAHAQPMHPVAMAAYAIYGAYYLSYKGLSKIAGGPYEEKTQQTEEPAMAEAQQGLSREDIENVIAEAENRFNVGPEQTLDRGVDSPDIEAVQTTGRSRFNDRMESFFADFFANRDKAAAPQGDDMQEAPQEAPQITRLPVTVIHSTLPHSEDIYVVPEGLPQVADALRERYGDHVQIIAPSQEQSVRDRIERRTVFYQGIPVNRTGAYEGTQPLRPETYTSTVYFEQGAILSPLQMPNAAGLLPLAQRRENAEAMSAFVAAARALQLEFQKTTGYQTDLGPEDDFVQFRYENADYLVTRPDCVEVRRGDELRARVALTTSGDIKVENFNIASDDYQEYHETPTYKVFVNPPASPSREQLLSLVDEMRATLETRGLVSSLDASVMTREQQDEYQEKLQNNFIREREDNLNIAMNDFANGQRMGLIPDADGTKVISRADVYAYVTYALNSLARETAKLDRDAKDTEKKMTAVVEARAATMEAVKDAKTKKEKAALEATAKNMQSEIDEYADQLGRLTSRQMNAFLQKANLEDLKQSLWSGAPYVCRKGDDKTLSVDIAGMTVKVKTKALSPEDRRKAAEALRAEPAEEQAERQAEAKVARPAPSKMTDEQIDREMAAHGQWLHENGEEGPQAQEKMERVRQLAIEKESRTPAVEVTQEQETEEPAVPQHKIVSPFQNDVCIVETDTGKAYADRQMNVISDSYPDLSPMGKVYGYAYNENREVKLINRDGSVEVDRWAKSYSKLGDGRYLVTFPDALNVFSVKTRGLLSDTDLVEIGTFDDKGVSIVQNKDGKFNYLTSEGGMLLDSWCDGVGEFKNNRAVVVVGTMDYEIDREGKITKAFDRSKSKGQNPSHA